MTRLKTNIWVSSYLKRLQQSSIPAFIVAKGDPENGAILIKVNTLDGHAKIFQRSYDLLQNRQCWIKFDEGDEKEIDGQLNRQCDRDTDLWIIEVEDREGRTLLDQSGAED